MTSIFPIYDSIEVGGRTDVETIHITYASMKRCRIVRLKKFQGLHYLIHPIFWKTESLKTYRSLTSVVLSIKHFKQTGKLFD